MSSASSAAASASFPMNPPPTSDTPPSPSVFHRSFILLLAFFSFSFLAFASISTLTHTYHHPSHLLSRILTMNMSSPLDSTDTPLYESQQTCEMSYFFLSHRIVEIKELSQISKEMLRGNLSMITALAATQQNKAAQPIKRRSAAEFDEEEEEEEIDLSDAESSFASSSNTNPEFLVFKRVFLNSLPRRFLSTATSRYRLLEYVELDNNSGKERHPSNPAAKAKRIPILFVHGNGGSYHQMRSLASRLTTIYNEDAEKQQQLNDFYSLDFFEEHSAFSGALLWQQAWFLNEALHTILAKYTPQTKVILVGHSMGGIVARAAWSLGNFPRLEDGSGSSRVAMLATLGSPHRAPVISTDEMMNRLYRIVNTRSGVNLTHLAPLFAPSTIHTDQPFIVSIGGGERDFQIESVLADLDGIYSKVHSLSLATHSLHHAPIDATSTAVIGIASVDHQCLCWCRQLMETLSFSIRAQTRSLLNCTQQAKQDLVQLQKRIWIVNGADELRAIAASSASSDPTSSSPATPSFTFTLTQAQLLSSSPLSVTLTHPSHEGLLIAWQGVMAEMKLCLSSDTAAECEDITHQVRLLSPVHPSHSSTSDVERVKKGFGASAYYLLHFAPNSMTSDKRQLRLTPHARTIEAYRSSSPSDRIRVSGMSYSSLHDLTSSSSFSLTSSGITRWVTNVPQGIDMHYDVTVDSSSEHATAFPTIALFLTTHHDELSFPNATYSDQFYLLGHSSSKQRRSVHVYRSGVARKLVGLFVRFPDSSSASSIQVSIHSHSFISFLHTAYLQFPLLPRFLLGVSFLLFGAQHDVLRRTNSFPRVHQLFTLPNAKAAGQSPIVWLIVVVPLLFQFLFHGSLSNDPLVIDSPSSTSSGGSGLLTGWSLSTSESSWLGLIGLVFCLACVFVHILVENIFFGVLWIGSRLVVVIKSIAKKLFGTTAAAPSDSSSTAPQRRYLIRLFHHLSIFLRSAFFVLSVIFSFNLALHASQFFGLTFLSHIYFVTQQIVAILSTAGMMSGILTKQVFLHEGLMWMKQNMMIDITPTILMAIIVGVALVFQVCTFPSSSGSTKSRTSAKSVRSSSAYKSSALTMMLLIGGILMLPTLLSSLRLDVDGLDRSWSAFYTQYRTDFMFQPPHARKAYDETLQVQGVHVSTDASDHRVISSPVSTVLFPFVLHSSLSPLVLLSLAWVTLLSWCAFHVPFSPPILQSTCITVYGLVLLFVQSSSPSAAFHELWWIVLMLCLCMMPHSMASSLYCVNIIWDEMEGKVGQYDLAYEEEQRRFRQYAQQIAQDEVKQQDGGASKQNSKKHK